MKDAQPMEDDGKRLKYRKVRAILDKCIICFDNQNWLFGI